MKHRKSIGCEKRAALLRLGDTLYAAQIYLCHAAERLRETTEALQKINKEKRK